ncbi:MAG: trypsin-like serine protease [Pseudobacteriovorax sp.]|nr:trypsin-like serine protease [Pseudobacteriovorax sp.]
MTLRRSPSTAFSALFAIILGLTLPLTGCGNRNEIGGAESSLSVTNPEGSVSTSPEIVRRSTVLLDMEYNYCSGTIVAEDKILTAAHCVSEPLSGEDIIVRFGPDMRDLRYGRVGIGKPRVHPRLDLAVIQIKGLPQGYQPAPIFDANVRLLQNDPVVLAGYGRTEAQKIDYAEFLRWGYSSFDQFMDEVSYGDGQVYRSILRFIAPIGGSSTCGGDSGGPIFREVNGQWGLTGVVSGGPIECHLSPETLGADPRPNRDWILAEFPNSADTCVVADSSGDESTNIRTWNADSPIVAALSNGAELTVRNDRFNPNSRRYISFDAYVETSKTSCADDPRSCIQRYSSVYLRASASEDAVFGVSGVELYSEPDKRTSPVGVVVEDTFIRVLDRLPNGWLRIEFSGTVGQRSCPDSFEI